MLTTTEAWDKNALTVLETDANLWGSYPIMGLYVNPVNPSKMLQLSDLVEASFLGYSRQNIGGNWGVYRDPIYGIYTMGTPVFQGVDPMTPQIVYGLFILFGPSGQLAGIEPFDPPISIVDSFDQLFVILQYIQSTDNPGFTKIIR